MKDIIIKILAFFHLGFIFKPYYGGVGAILFMHKVVEKRPQKKRLPMIDANEIDAGYLDKMISFLKRKNYEIISLDEMVKRLHSKTKTKKFVVFTFDDGYKDNLTVAYPIFKKHNVPFAIYITNCFPNGNAMLWWDLIAEIIQENQKIIIAKEITLNTENLQNKEKAFTYLRKKFLASNLKEQSNLIEELCKTYDKKIQDFAKEETLTWAEIQKLSEDPLVTIGAHTQNHGVLRQLSEKEIIAEVVLSQKELEEKLLKNSVHFAYPYGTPNEVGQREIDIVSENTSFKTAVTTRTGTIFPEHAKTMMLLPRIQILGNQQKLSILELYLSGLLPALKNKFKRRVTL